MGTRWVGAPSLRESGSPASVKGTAGGWMTLGC
jgi:hypothetical protein